MRHSDAHTINLNSWAIAVKVPCKIFKLIKIKIEPFERII